MRGLPLFTCLLVTTVAACGDDETTPPARVDAAAIDAPPTIDAPMVDAAIDAPLVDAATDAAVDGAIDAQPDAPVPTMTNGCLAAAAVDRTAPGASRTITFPGFAYVPACMTIKVGQAVTWSGDLSFHPLRPGLVVGGVPMNQAGNPVPSVSAGASANATFAAAGTFGYYCLNHFGGGMMGAIYVVP